MLSAGGRSAPDGRVFLGNWLDGSQLAAHSGHSHSDRDRLDAGQRTRGVRLPVSVSLLISPVGRVAIDHIRAFYYYYYNEGLAIVLGAPADPPLIIKRVR